MARSLALSRFFSLAGAVLLLLAVSHLSPAAFLSVRQDPPPPSVFDILEQHGLPRGLLPDTVAAYTLAPDGAFTVQLAAPCYATIPSGIHIYYGPELSGVLTDRQLAGLRGISAKSTLFVWVQVRSIYVDQPASGEIHFRTSLLTQTLAIEEFRESPACQVAAAPPGGGGGGLRADLGRHREVILDLLQ